MASSAKETLSFKQFYNFLQSLACPNTLKVLMICEKLKVQRPEYQLEKTFFNVMYADYFSGNAPYRIAVGDFTREALKTCVELADPLRIKDLLLLLQPELRVTISQGNSFDFYFIYSLVNELFHAKNEVRVNFKSACRMPQQQPSKTSRSKSYPLQVANPHQVSNMALAKKLEEVKNDRTLMEENAKKEKRKKW